MFFVRQFGICSVFHNIEIAYLFRLVCLIHALFRIVFSASHSRRRISRKQVNNKFYNMWRDMEMT